MIIVFQIEDSDGDKITFCLSTPYDVVRLQAEKDLSGLYQELKAQEEDEEWELGELEEKFELEVVELFGYTVLDNCFFISVER